VRFSLPLRIFLMHLVFTVGAAGLAVYVVDDQFRRYKERWEQEVETLPGEVLFQPFASEVARSLLLRLEGGFAEEVEEHERGRISDAVGILLRELPSVRGVVVVDRDGKIQYASESEVVDLTFTGDDDASLLAADAPVRREITDPDGERVTQVFMPVYDNPATGEAAAPRRRLGSIIMRYAPDPALTARVPSLEQPSIATRQFLMPLIGYLALVAVGGVLLAILIGVPVRRLDRALQAFREKGFEGSLPIDRRELKGELGSAIRAINEMGGRLEALAARGREREALLATLAQSLEEGMLALEPSGTPVAWNEAARRILTAGPPRPVDADDDTGDDRVALAHALRLNGELLDPGDGAAVHQVEIEVVQPEGVRIPVQVTRVPFETRPGEQGTLLLLRDLAALRSVETHLLEAGRYAGLAHVAAGLAHEIRNPLHAIGLNAEVVEQYLGMDPTDSRRASMTESLNSIKQETRRLTDLLNNYLGLVRPDAGTGPVEIPELCRRVQRLLSYAASQSDVEIRVDVVGDVPPVEGVASRLQQAILNLVLNSIQAMPRGGIVMLRSGVRDGFIELAVEDTGPGLPNELERQLFEERITTRAEGSGLGLPLVRMIAEAHGGQIAYRPRSGGGASMVLRLPHRAAAPAAATPGSRE
jgi:signal transduction histidine kinase